MKKRNRKQNRKGMKNKFFVLILSLLLVMSSTVLIGADFIEHNSYKTESIAIQKTQKLYKSIQINSGDTLWSIAKEYTDQNYQSVEEYMDELVKINHLSTDLIVEGQYLTVVYYV